jgi:hypothetical protein
MYLISTSPSEIHVSQSRPLPITRKHISNSENENNSNSFTNPFEITPDQGAFLFPVGVLIRSIRTPLFSGQAPERLAKSVSKRQINDNEETNNITTSRRKNQHLIIKNTTSAVSAQLQAISPTSISEWELADMNP